MDSLFRLALTRSLRERVFSIPCLLSLGILLGLLLPNSAVADLSRWHTNASTRLRLPADYKLAPYQEQVYDGKLYQLTLFSRSFRQGDLVYAEVTAPANRKLASSLLLQLIYDGQPVHLNRTEWGYRSFFALPPQKRAGKYSLQVVLFDTQGHQVEDNFHLSVGKADFTVSRSPIRLRRGAKQLSPEKREQIRKERAIKKGALSHRSREIMIGSALAHPCKLHKITSPFWATRLIQYYSIRRGKRIYSKSRRQIHQGVDLRARSGDPIYAVAGGRVLLSRKMHYEGNFILIDHGQGMLSGYMHLSRRNVWRGKRVLAGQKIGYAGSTGQVTGAHLHWLLYVRNVPVSPLSLLSLPVRN